MLRRYLYRPVQLHPRVRRVASISFGAHAVPRYEPRGSGKEKTEDAHFYSLHRYSAVEASPVAIFGIADGVGSWRAHGVDPSLFSRSLLDSVERHFVASASTSPSNVELLEAGWKSVVQNNVIGSCTVLLGTIQQTIQEPSASTFSLRVTSLGDCGLYVIRKTAGQRYAIAYESKRQVRKFNLPFQIGNVGSMEGSGGATSPSSFTAAAAAVAEVFEHPKQAITENVTVRSGDIIIAATDGFFDNMFSRDILESVHVWDKGGVGAGRRGSMSKSSDDTSANALAQSLVKDALAFSSDKMKDGPFALEAKDNDILWTKGGHPDDITVVVGLL